MSKYKWLFIAFAMFPLFASGINKLTPVYMFGFAASFNDSIVYLTEIQRIDSAWIDSKTKFLYGRNNFSHQLYNHLSDAGNNHPTCMVMFADERKKIEKKYLKFRKRYTSKGAYIVKYVDANTFNFSPISLSGPEALYTPKELKEAIKKEKAEVRAAQKAAKAKIKADQNEKKAAKAKAMEEAKERAKQLKAKK